MRRHHAGSGHRAVVDPDWSASLATAVEGFMTEATVHLRRPGGTETFNSTTGLTSVTPFVPFALFVPAKIQPISANEVGVVEEQAWVLGYRVAVARDVAPTPTQLDEGIIVDVVTCTDPTLVGAHLRVTDVVRGTHLLERELVTEAGS